MKKSELPEVPPPSWREVYEFLVPFFRPWKWRLAILLLLSLLSMVLIYLDPFVQKEFINGLTFRQRPDVWYWGGAAMLLIALRRLLAGAVLYGENAVGNRIALALRKRMGEKLLDLPVPFFRQHGSGYLAGRFSGDIDEIQNFFTSGVMTLLTSALKLGGGVILLLVFDWRVGLAAAAVLPLYFLVYLKFRRSSYEVGRAFREASARSSRTLHATFAGIAGLKSSAAEKRRGERLGREFEQVALLRFRRFWENHRYRIVLQMIPAVCHGGLIAVGIWMILEGQWTLGGLWALSRLLDYVFSPGQLLCGQLLRFQPVLAASARVMQLDRLLPEENLEKGIEVEKLSGSIEFRKVEFGYLPGVPVLKELSFTVAPGEKVALCGASGSGKSTILGLLLRFYRQDKGEILLDSRPAGDYQLRSLRSRIGYISQGGDFVQGSLQGFLHLGLDAPLPESKLYEALQAVGLSERIAGEGGLNSELGEQATRFSVGERLRLDIARELLRNPDILILDEATANLDSETEKNVMEMLCKVFDHKTILMVSHRESTLRFADRKLLLQNGRIS